VHLDLREKKWSGKISREEAPSTFAYRHGDNGPSESENIAKGYLLLLGYDTMTLGPVSYLR